MPDEDLTESREADENPPVILTVSLDGETDGLADRSLETEFIGRWLALRIAGALSTYVEIDASHRINVDRGGESVNVNLAEYVRQALLLRSIDAAEPQHGNGFLRISYGEVQQLIDRLLDNPNARAQCADFVRALPIAAASDSTDIEEIPIDEHAAFMEEQLALSSYVIEKMRQLLWIEAATFELSDQWPQIRAALGGPYTGACVVRVGDVLTQLAEKRRVQIDVNALRRDARNLLMSIIAVDDGSTAAESRGEGEQ